MSSNDNSMYNEFLDSTDLEKRDERLYNTRSDDATITAAIKLIKDSLIHVQVIKRFFLFAYLNIYKYIQELPQHMLMNNGGIPWKELISDDNNNILNNNLNNIQLMKEWEISDNNMDDAQLMLAMLEYWRKDLFEDNVLKVGRSATLGIGIYAKGKYTTINEIRDNCIGYVFELSEGLYNRLKDYRYPALVRGHDNMTGIMFGKLALVNHQYNKRSMWHYESCGENLSQHIGYRTKVILLPIDRDDIINYNRNEYDTDIVNQSVYSTDSSNKPSKLTHYTSDCGKNEQEFHVISNRYEVSMGIVKISNKDSDEIFINLENGERQLFVQYYPKKAVKDIDVNIKIGINIKGNYIPADEILSERVVIKKYVPKIRVINKRRRKFY